MRFNCTRFIGFDPNMNGIRQRLEKFMRQYQFNELSRMDFEVIIYARSSNAPFAFFLMSLVLASFTTTLEPNLTFIEKLPSAAQSKVLWLCDFEDGSFTKWEGMGPNDAIMSPGNWAKKM